MENLQGLYEYIADFPLPLMIFPCRLPFLGDVMAMSFDFHLFFIGHTLQKSPVPVPVLKRIPSSLGFLFGLGRRHVLKPPQFRQWLHGE
jgi:hypothetical protein